MANGLFARAVFILSIICVNEVVVVAMRTNIKNKVKIGLDSNVSKTPDMDWDGCATLWGCTRNEGCARKHLWLDTPRQSCRYSDAYKLQSDQIGAFFPTELLRLEEKTEKFASKGCLTGGWWWKCYRRMQQILRLFNYVRKAKAVVLASPETFPDNTVEYMNSQGVKERFARIADNIATGFGKNPQTKHMCMGEGMRKMVNIPDRLQAKVAEAAEQGIELTQKELVSLEQTFQTVALLAMNCKEVSDEEAMNLRAFTEASGQGGAGEQVTTGHDLIDDMVQDQSDQVTMLDNEDMRTMNKAANEEADDDELDVDNEDDVEAADDLETREHKRLDDDDSGQSLAQLSSQGGNTSLVASRDGPLKMLVKNSWKGLKWVVSHGVGWLFRRLAWTLAFLVGFSFSVVRALVLWPALFIMCGTARSVSWVFKDVLWNGKDIKKGFMNIGHCAPDMWNTVGFDSRDPSNSALSQILLNPVRDASWVSGVHHAWKEGKPDYCRQVTCGTGAVCRVVSNDLATVAEGEPSSVGKCFCQLGMYAAGGTGCGLKVATSGCPCQNYWTTWGLGYYGCNENGECKVTSGCTVNLDTNSSFLGRIAKSALGLKKTIDSCAYERSGLQVDPVAVDNTIDVWAKP